MPVAEVDHGSETATAVTSPSAMEASRTRLAGMADNALFMMRDRLSASPLEALAAAASQQLSSARDRCDRSITFCRLRDATL
jgi:hypothetical protein